MRLVEVFLCNHEVEPGWEAVDKDKVGKAYLVDLDNRAKGTIGSVLSGRMKEVECIYVVSDGSVDGGGAGYLPACLFGLETPKGDPVVKEKKDG